MSEPRNKMLLLALIAALGGALVWTLFFWHPQREAMPLRQAPAAPKGGDFTLQSAAGALSLHDLRGKVVVLYFGYTFCPDICPTSLAFTAQGLSALSKEEQARVQMLFVTVDPARDTLEKLKEYTAFFYPGMIGLTGTPEEISGVAKRYGAMYAQQKVASVSGYVVDHSADTYLIAPDGTLHGTLAHATPPAKVAEAIRKILNPR